MEYVNKIVTDKHLSQREALKRFMEQKNKEMEAQFLDVD